MAETIYIYSIATEFTSSGGEFSSEGMISEIQASAIVTALEEGKMKRDDDDVEIVFKDALSPGDETILDGLVADHTGEPPSPVGEVITTDKVAGDGSPVFSGQILALGRESFKRNGDGSELMNVDGSPAGTPVAVWNGTGAGDTGGDWTVGGVGSEAAAADAGDGTNGWDTGVTALNDAWAFDNGSMIAVDGTYDELSFMLNPQAFPAGSRLFVGFLDDTSTLVGNAVRIDNQLPNMDLDVWQRVSLDIAQFNLTGNVQQIRFQARNAAGQQYYLDDIELVAAGGGGPFRFGVRAPAGQNWHMSMLVLKISGPTAGWDDDVFATLAGGIVNGLLLRQRRLSTSETLWRFVTRDNDELGGYYHPQDSITWANDIMTLGFMIKPGKASVIVTDDDVLEFVVRDDLSGISKMRAYLHYGVEEVA
ncbi:MAG: hypothetical protein KJN79_01145 [Gammaproteobacteria bacterium]|nr:hypothetical protein [Gammaproteobacteria bacterium]